MSNNVWVDVETTGLSIDDDFLLEVGLVITSPAPIWAPLAEKSVILPFDNKPEDGFIQVVQTMHEANGLWDECRRWMELPFDMLGIEQEMMNWVIEHDAVESPMFGNTVHFDRMWLKDQFPRFEAQFHYRNFDVSTLKQYALAIDGDVSWWMDREIHRGVPDNQDAIANLIHFRNRFK